jgi:PTS system nitrogen regulatory IIA component
MKISEILSFECILCAKTLLSKKTATEELAKLISDTESSLNRAEVFECLVSREKLGSTGIGHGVAIPHGRLEGNKKTIAAFIQLQHSIDYGAVDQIPVDLFFALIVPENSTDEHLKILSYLAEMFSHTKTLDQLRSETTVAGIHKILTE